MTERLAPAKLNLALAVGPTRPDGRHEVATVLQRISWPTGSGLSRRPSSASRASPRTRSCAPPSRSSPPPRSGTGLASRDREAHPVAAGLGGGSSDAAAALELANETLREPLDASALHTLAARLGADVPFFLTAGPQLGEDDGTTLQPLALPQDYWILLLLPHGERKNSTAAVYSAFTGEEGFAERRAGVMRALALGDLAALPPNDLASSPLGEDLRALGAFRADVSGAGPAVFGLFAEQETAIVAHAALGDRGGPGSRHLPGSVSRR